MVNTELIRKIIIFVVLITLGSKIYQVFDKDIAKLGKWFKTTWQKGNKRRKDL